MLPSSHIEISQSALEHNLHFLKNIIGPKVTYSSVVKGNAYGHGIEIFVPLAETCGVRHFSVFSADEAWRVNQASKHPSKILIMGMLDNEQLDWVIDNDIEFYVFELDRLENAVKKAIQMKKVAKVHIELETGMNRTGFSQNDLPKVVQILQANSSTISFRGLCTHFAGAESIANHYRIQKQQGIYNRTFRKLEKLDLVPDIRHTACSAAILRYPKTHLDLVRIGILQYGFFPSREILIHYLTQTKQLQDPLQRLISWKSRVMDVKSIKKANYIGYGNSYLANIDMKIATIPVGYSHGFNRSLSNQGRVLIRGQRVPVIGIVNMNMISVDITNVVGVEKGDEVVIIGKQGGLEISVSSFSEFSDQINYELLTRLPSNIPRLVIP